MLEKLKAGGWRAAIVWGVGIALTHRILLGAWLAGVWTFMGRFLEESVNFHDPGGALPALNSPLEELVFGVWRRWDAIHYYRLSIYGYDGVDPGPTVFGVLTPFGFNVFDAVMPGGVDLAALIFETVAFAIMLTLLYRVVEVYYDDLDLAPWAVIVTALLPLSYWFSAPMSESIYMVFVLGLFYFAARQRWLVVAICGALATLARSQGVVLVGVAGLILLEQHPPSTWLTQIRLSLRRTWVLGFIPLALIGFEAWRLSLGLPTLSETYRTYSFNYFANPVEGLYLNLRWFIIDPIAALRTLDLPVLVLALVLAGVMLFYPKHRRLALVVYTFGYILLFVSRVNYWYGSTQPWYTQSFARYSLVLFPLWVMLADGIRHLPFWGRIVCIVVLSLGAVLFSAFYVLALTGP